MLSTSEAEFNLVFPAIDNVTCLSLYSTAIIDKMGLESHLLGFSVKAFRIFVLF